MGASEAALLGKLGVKPFKYGLEVLKVYENGSLFDVAVLDITDAGAWGAGGQGEGMGVTGSVRASCGTHRRWGQHLHEYGKTASLLRLTFRCTQYTLTH